MDYGYGGASGRRVVADGFLGNLVDSGCGGSGWGRDDERME